MHKSWKENSKNSKRSPCDLCHNVSSFAKICKDQRIWRTSLKNCIYWIHFMFLNLLIRALFSFRFSLFPTDCLKQTRLTSIKRSSFIKNVDRGHLFRPTSALSYFTDSLDCSQSSIFPLDHRDRALCVTGCHGGGLGGNEKIRAANNPRHPPPGYIWKSRFPWR